MHAVFISLLHWFIAFDHFILAQVPFLDYGGTGALIEGKQAWRNYFCELSWFIFIVIYFETAILYLTICSFFGLYYRFKIVPKSFQSLSIFCVWTALRFLSKFTKILSHYNLLSLLCLVSPTLLAFDGYCPLRKPLLSSSFFIWKRTVWSLFIHSFVYGITIHWDGIFLHGNQWQIKQRILVVIVLITFVKNRHNILLGSKYGYEHA